MHLLEKAVTAPFSLLANAFGGSRRGTGLRRVRPGLGQAHRRRQREARHDREGAGRQTVDPHRSDRPRRSGAVDEPGLRTAYVERHVKQEKIKDVARQSEIVQSTVTVSAGIRQVSDQGLQVADFKKPRNFVGLTKSVPDDDMKSALADNAPVDEALSALAQQRAAERAAIFRRQDRQQPGVYRRAETERRRHQGQGRDDAGRLRAEVTAKRRGDEHRWIQARVLDRAY